MGFLKIFTKKFGFKNYFMSRDSLRSVLEAARAPVEGVGGAGKQRCGGGNKEDCCCPDGGAGGKGGGVASATQVKFRELRREIAGARKNVRRLLEICVPDTGEEED